MVHIVWASLLQGPDAPSARALWDLLAACKLDEHGNEVQTCPPGNRKRGASADCTPGGSAVSTPVHSALAPHKSCERVPALAHPLHTARMGSCGSL
jgi:hypothetical protein